MIKNKFKIFKVFLCLVVVIICLFAIKVLAYTINKNTVKLVKSGMGDGIYEINHQYKSVFNQTYQNKVDKAINKKIKNNNYTFNNPLIVYNPYGTNTLGLNIYFDTDKKASLSYVISASDTNDYSNTLFNNSEDNMSTHHEYQIIGLVPNKENKIKLTLTYENGESESKEILINVPKLKKETEITISSKSGESTELLENGLFAILGHDKSFSSNIYLFDNNGQIRSELILEDYRADRIEFIDDKMFYPINDNKLALVNRLGMIEKNYKIDGYKMHHDFIYDEKENKVLILADEIDSDTEEDIIITLDLNSGDIEELIDLKDYFKESYESAVKPEDAEKLDWIHINSLDLTDDGLLLSSRELSAIIKMENIYTEPNISYIIADESVFKGTEVENLVLSKIGDFVSNAGQHTVTYTDDNDTNDSTYYVSIYNNNYNGAATRPNFDWSNYPGTGSYEDGEKSMYYKYLVNEDDKTYKLIESIDVPYSSIVSSIQFVDDHYVISSGKSHTYGEYDKDGVLIKQFEYSSEKFSYRVFKYNFNNIWFK